MANQASQFGNWGLNWTKAKLKKDYIAFRDRYAPGIPDEVMTPVAFRDIKIENESDLMKALYANTIRREFNRRMVTKAMLMSIGLIFYLGVASLIGMFTKAAAVVAIFAGVFGG